mmetsp:Transcript_39686/g.78173  ORF Transcript_39686/g.78173 Transcript_39686/m.78173 type:complete len:399 (+) Transcript_39686:360-1556(+)
MPTGTCHYLVVMAGHRLNVYSLNPASIAEIDTNHTKFTTLSALTMRLLGWVLSRVENSDMTRLHLQVGAEIPGVEAEFPLTMHISQLHRRSRVQAASTSPNREADTTRFLHSVTDQIMANERAQRHLDINAYTGDFFDMARWSLRRWSYCAQGINVTAQVSVRVSDTEGFLDPAVKALAEAGPPLLKLHSSPDLATRPYFTQVIKMYTQKDFMEGEYSFDLMQEQCALLASIAKRFFFEPHPSHSCSKAEHNEMDRCLKQEQVTDLVRSYGLPYLKNPHMLSSQKYRFIVSTCRNKEPPSPVFDVKWGPWKKGAPTSAQFVVQPGMSAQEKAGRVKLWERFGLGIFSTEVERHRRVRDRAWVLWANFLGQKEDSPVAQKAWSMFRALLIADRRVFSQC